MSAVACHLWYHSTSPHLQQLYTGFWMLHTGGFIRLSQQQRRTPCRYASDAPHLRNAGHAHLDAVLDERLRLHFDTHDSKEIAVPELEGCDFYFKRSYCASVVDALPESQKKKLRPLGLNYRVLPDCTDPFAMRRGASLHGMSRATLSAFRAALDTGNQLGFQPRLADMHAAPRLDAEPRVLFQAAAYDPHDDPDRARDKIEERVLLNDARAQCIRLLRETFGDRFLGGFIRSPFTLERYPDLVLPAQATPQQTYLKTLKSYSIGVATSGLHGSTGWKLAEYVAFAKAIVSQKLRDRLPGSFECERNYREFASPEECVKGVVKLIEDPSLRQEFMRNNAAYYQSHLRPDCLVRNALSAALAQSSR